MNSTDIWPVAFVVWKAKGEEALEAIKQGQITAHTGKNIHARKNALFVILQEDGLVLAIGQIVNINKWQYELSLHATAKQIDKGLQLSKKWLDQVKAIPRPFLKGPISGIIITPDNKDAILDESWFKAVYNFSMKKLPKEPKATTTTPVAAVAVAKPQQQTKKQTVIKDTEKESLLKSWIPPALVGLLDDHVRAD
ncbi:MAG: hypothetical protein HQL69_23660, partial [Magnetococcales bacterium]|nr:hypothetical protein [Magnetococcales bacterium]